MSRVANKSERYEDLVSFLREIVKGSHENVFNDICNLLRTKLKIFISFQKSYCKAFKSKKAYVFMLSTNHKNLRINENVKINPKTGIYDWVGTGACLSIDKDCLKVQT